MLGIGLVVGCGIGLSLGMRPAPPDSLATHAASDSPRPTSCIAVSDAPTGTTSTAPAPSPTTAASANDTREKLLELLAGPNPARNWSEINEQLSTWCQSDPAAALAFIQHAPRFPMRNSALTLPLAAIARNDPDSAAAWLRTHATEIDRRRIADEVATTIADSNPREALAFANANVHTSEGIVGYVIGKLAATAPADAAALFTTLAESERATAALMVGQNWATHDPTGALRWSATLTNERCATAAATGALLALAEEDPHAAAEALSRYALPPEAASSALRAIANADPALALSTVSTLPTAKQTAVARTLVETALESAPDRIAALGRSLLPEADFAAALRQAWTAWRESDRPAAEAWADTVTDLDLRNRLASIKLADSAESDPALFLASLDAVPDAYREPQSIQSALANLPPPDAARWVASHASAIPTAAAVQTAESYFNADQAAADSWARNLPVGEARDQALSSVAGNWGLRGETDRATGALAAISDPLARTATSFQIFNTLHGQSPDTAVAWLATQPLSAEVRTNWEAVAAGTQSFSGIAPCD